MEKNNQYFARKAQLYNAMKEALLGMEYGFGFDMDDDSKVFYPIWLSCPREEHLWEVYLTDPDDYTQDVVVVTAYQDESGQFVSNDSEFSEFSNDEMETIMRFCGVEIPQEGEFYVE